MSSLGIKRSFMPRINWVYVFLAVFSLSVVGAIYWITLQNVPILAKEKDIIFINKQIKALNEDILDLKLQLQRTEALLQIITEGKDVWLSKIKDLSELHKFLSDQKIKSRQPLSDGQSYTKKNIPTLNGSKAP